MPENDAYVKQTPDIKGRRRKSKMATIRERDGDLCWICGKPMRFDDRRLRANAASFDHVVPRSEGGANANENLRLAHRRCNTRRGSGTTDAR